jgi:hypothetical protein
MPCWKVLTRKGSEHFGVSLECDDGYRETIEAASREAAELTARDRIDDFVPIQSRFECPSGASVFGGRQKLRLFRDGLLLHEP